MTGDVRPADRVRWLGRNARLSVLASGLLVVALLVGVTATLGLFSSTSANPENVMSAGRMSQVNSARNRAIMTAGGLLPGDLVQGTATVRNVGDAAGEFRLAVTDVADVPGPGGGLLSERLHLRVFESRRVLPVYSGPLGGLDVPLGTWQPGEQRTYRFRARLIGWRPRTDNLYQQSRVTVTFEWTAVQVP